MKRIKSVDAPFLCYQWALLYRVDPVTSGKDLLGWMHFQGILLMLQGRRSCGSLADTRHIKIVARSISCHRFHEQGGF